MLHQRLADWLSCAAVRQDALQDQRHGLEAGVGTGAPDSIEAYE